MTKYGFDIDNMIIDSDARRLTNQLWKLIPMKENGEDWETQLASVIVEIAGLSEVLQKNDKYLILLSKLEGIKLIDIDFQIFRKTVFESISLLREGLV